MVDTKTIATRMEAWAEATSSVTAYPDEPQNYSAAFPLVACRIVTDSEQETPPQFGEHLYQQVRVEIITTELMIFVDPVPGWTSDQALYDIVDELKASLRLDETLGGRFEAVSPLYSVDYLGEAQMADGTAANAATMTLTLAQKVSVE